MSNRVFPTLPGLAWRVRRRPEWNNSVRAAESGREFVKAGWSSPRYRYSLDFEFLRAGAERELQALEAFFNLHGGRYDTWLFSDPDDNAVTLQQLGIGNASQTAYQLVRSRQDWIDPIYSPNGTPRVFINTGDWQGDREVYSTARTNLLKRSGAFNFDSDWVKREVVLSGPVSGPDGTTSAWQLREAASTAVHDMYQAFAVTAGQTYTASFWLRAGSHSVAQLVFSGAGFTVDAYATVNIATGAVGSRGSACTVRVGDILPSGWRRVFVTATAVATLSAEAVSVVMVNDNINAVRSPTYLGDVANNFQAAFAQIEVGSVGTTYIPTAAVSVTQSAEFTLGSLGVVNLTSAPAAGALVKATFNYYWRCRFEQDGLDFEKFMQDLWTAQRVSFYTWKP